MKKSINKLFIIILSVLMILSLSITSGCSNAEQIASDSASSASDSGNTEKDIINYTTAITADLPNEVDVSNYKTYYFDSKNGDDSNSGRSVLVPKKTLSAASEIAALANENYPIRLLFKRGSEFFGRLVLTGFTATADKPLIVSDYGNDSSPSPKFLGLSSDTSSSYEVVRLTESNTRISNLEITDKYAYQGINICAIRAGKIENVVIENCYVHDVNFFTDENFDENNPPDTAEELDAICPEFNKDGSYGRYYYRYNGGIIFSNNTPQSIGASWFENVYAINNFVERVARTGIYMYTKWSNCPGVGYGNNKFVEQSDRYNDAEKGIGYFMHKNVNFIGNRLNVIGGDGIVLAGIDSFLEGNVCYRANYLGRTGKPNAQGVSTRYYNGGIWVYNSENVYFQGNEAAYTFYRNGSGDGEGFDIDNSCKNVYFQYNYSHHNEGGGILICNMSASLTYYDKDGNVLKTDTVLGDWRNNYCRNNVFAYNGTMLEATKSAFITIARRVNEFYAYNNTVILGDIPGQDIIHIEDQQSSAAHYYANNIFYSKSNMEIGARFSVDLLSSKTCENNLYYGVGCDLNDKVGAMKGVDPLISLPDEFDGLDKIAQFRGSEPKLFTNGKLINGALSEDISGNSAENISYLGAFCK